MIVSFKDVTKIYTINLKTNIEVLSRLSMEIKKGDFLAITGPSGCGKTTLLRLLAGLSPVSGGEIIVSNYTITNMTQESLALFRSVYVGLVFQDFQLIQTLTCLENVMLPAELSEATTKEAYTSARKLLIEVGLETRLNHYPLQLSGGEQQRTTWARAYVNKPPVIIADEPTANLDSKTKKFIFLKLKETLDDPEITTIVSTHEEIIEDFATCKLVFNETTKLFDFIRVSEPRFPKNEQFEEFIEESLGE